MYALKRASAGRDTGSPLATSLDAGRVAPGPLHPGAGRAGVHDVPCSTSVPALLALARQRIAESDPAVVEGSITDLSRFGNEQFDAVLCLGGVLSHVVEAAPRRQALARAAAGSEAGALSCFIAVMNRPGRLPLDRAVAELLHTILPRTCRRRVSPAIGPGGALTYYFLPEEFVSSLARGGPRTGAVVWLQRSGSAIYRKRTSTH